jgi:hypothetical protein
MKSKTILKKNGKLEKYVLLFAQSTRVDIMKISKNDEKNLSADITRFTSWVEASNECIKW